MQIWRIDKKPELSPPRGKEAASSWRTGSKVRLDPNT